MDDDNNKFRRMVDELNEKFTLEYIAQEIGVSVRQVSNYKAGDRPKGFTAIRLYLFHDKHRTAVPETGTLVHGESAMKGG